MLKSIGSYLFGTVEDSSEKVELATTETEEDWVYVHVLEDEPELLAFNSSPTTYFPPASPRLSPRTPPPTNPPLSLSIYPPNSPSSTNTTPPLSPQTMDGSWFVTPPSCFTRKPKLPVVSSPLENLLIEHPSMSVYDEVGYFKIMLSNSSNATDAKEEEANKKVKKIGGGRRKSMRTKENAPPVDASLPEDPIVECKVEESQSPEQVVEARPNPRAARPALHNPTWLEIVDYDEEIREQQKCSHRHKQYPLSRGQLHRTNLVRNVLARGTGRPRRCQLLPTQNSGIEAIWGRKLINAESAAKDLSIPFWTSEVDDVLLRKDVSLIYIACAPRLHAQIAVKALGIGKHVLCDQPAGLCQAEAMKMVHASQYYPSLIGMLGNGLRFLPAFTQMRRAIHDGYIGNQVTFCDIKVQTGNLVEAQEGSVNGFDWHCDSRMGGGVLFLLGSHLIDIITFLIGQRGKRVHGLVRTFKPYLSSDQVGSIRRITSPDFCTFQMEMDGGALVTVSLTSQLEGTFVQEVLVCGNKGHLVIRGGDLYGQTEELNKEEVIYLDVEDLRQTAAPSSGPCLPKPYLKGLLKLISSLRESFKSPSQHSVEGWRMGPLLPAASFEDCQYVQAVMEAVLASSRRREWTKVTIVTEEPDPDPLLSAAVRKSTISMRNQIYL